MGHEQQTLRQPELPAREVVPQEAAVAEVANSAAVAKMPPEPAPDPTPLLTTFAAGQLDEVAYGDPVGEGPGRQLLEWSITEDLKDARNDAATGLVDRIAGRDGSPESPSLRTRAHAWATRNAGATYEVDEAGRSVIRADDDWSLSGGAASGPIGVSGSILQDQDATLSMGAGAAGAPRSAAEMRGHLESFEGELGSGPDVVGDGLTSVDAFMETIGELGEGDAFERTSIADWSLGASASAHGVKVGYGVGETERQQERYSVDEAGRVIVEVAHSDADRQQGSVEVRGVLGATAGSEETDGIAMELAFDIANEDPAVAEAARRDLALYRFSGLLPGTADALGIEDYDDAVAWLEAQEERLEADGRSVTELNEAALEAAKGDADYRDAHGYVSIADHRGATQDHGATALGVDLWRRHASQDRGTVLVDGEEIDTGASSVERWNLLTGGSREGGQVAADQDGSFSALYSATDNERAAELADGPLAEAMRADSAVGEAVDDPTLIRAISGDLDAMGEIAATWSRTAGPLDGSMATVAFQEALAAGIDAGRDPHDVIAEVEAQADEVAAMGASGGTLADLSPGAFDLYVAGLQSDAVGDGRFQAIAALATLEDKSRAADALADLAASGDVDAIYRFEQWLVEQGLEGTISVDSGLVAGSSHLEALGGALDDGDRRTAAAEAGSLITKLEDAEMDPAALEETLAGFDISGAGEDAGGLRRFYDAMSPEDRARFIELAGSTEAGGAFLAGLAEQRPDLMLDADGQLLPGFETVVAPRLGSEEFDSAVYQEQAAAAREAALREGDGSSLPVELAGRWATYVEHDPNLVADLDALRSVMGSEVGFEDLVRIFTDDDSDLNYVLINLQASYARSGGQLDPAMISDLEWFEEQRAARS